MIVIIRMSKFLGKFVYRCQDTRFFLAILDVGKDMDNCSREQKMNYPKWFRVLITDEEL